MSTRIFRPLRPGIGAISLLALMALLAAGCGGGGNAQEEEQASSREESSTPLSGEFVGEIPGTDTFLSIVAEEGDERRKVRAYLCDGKQLTEWFTGTMSGDELDLASENDVRLRATLAPESASSTITLANGEDFDFDVPPSASVAGYYPVDVTAEEVSGASWSGGQLEGERAGETASGAISPPEGERVGFEVSESTIEEGENRWIVLEEDGRPRIKGASKNAKSTGFIDPTTDFRKPGFIDPTSDL